MTAGLRRGVLKSCGLQMQVSSTTSLELTTHVLLCRLCFQHCVTVVDQFSLQYLKMKFDGSGIVRKPHGAPSSRFCMQLIYTC